MLLSLLVAAAVSAATQHFVPSKPTLGCYYELPPTTEEVVTLNKSVRLWNTIIGRRAILIGTNRTGNVELLRVDAMGSDDEGETVGQWEMLSSGLHLIQYTATQHGLELDSIIVHELGHALGLNHNSNPNSVMFAVPEAGSTPDSHDGAEARSRWR